MKKTNYWLLGFGHYRHHSYKAIWPISYADIQALYIIAVLAYPIYFWPDWDMVWITKLYLYFVTTGLILLIAANLEIFFMIGFYIKHRELPRYERPYSLVLPILIITGIAYLTYAKWNIFFPEI